MRRSKQELQARWMARKRAATHAPASADQALRDDLNPRNSKMGAPAGNKNRLTHGCYTAERQALEADTRTLASLTRTLVALCAYVDARG